MATARALSASLLIACLLWLEAHGRAHDDGGFEELVDKTFIGHHLLSVKIEDKAHVKTLLDVKDSLDLDIWNHAIKEGHTGLLSVPPERVGQIMDVMESAGMKYQVNSDNLQSLINEEKRLIAPDDVSAEELSAQLLDYSRYYSYKSIAGESNLPIIVIDCGVHAREWITVSACMYIVNELVTRHQDQSSDIAEVFNYEWRIIPCLNPDGYEYSRNSNRMWRKNRSVQYNGNGTKCYGTDINRNFDVSFCSTPDEADPCKETFCGKAPFSEPESHAFREYVTEFRNRTAFYFSFHAFGDLWLIPYGFRSDRAPDYDELMTRANRAVDAIQRVSGTYYKAGSIASLLYIAPGTAIDWMYVKRGVRMSFTVEISSEKNGFFLNQTDVIDVPKQAWIGVAASIRQ
ncbi:carboxypeptidase B-like isoform X2 [Haemaphysalis longicornis]